MHARVYTRIHIDAHVHCNVTPPIVLELGLYACSPSVPLHKDPWYPKGKKSRIDLDAHVHCNDTPTWVFKGVPSAPGLGGEQFASFRAASKPKPLGTGVPLEKKVGAG